MNAGLHGERVGSESRSVYRTDPGDRKRFKWTYRQIDRSNATYDGGMARGGSTQ